MASLDVRGDGGSRGGSGTKLSDAGAYVLLLLLLLLL
jgi:hypothetical protein